jgi:hypothetical protein
MLVTAGDTAADPVPVTIETPLRLVAAPHVTGCPIGTRGTPHRPPAPGTGPCGGHAW